LTVKYAEESGVDGGGLVRDLASSTIKFVSTILSTGPQSESAEHIAEWEGFCRGGGFFIGVFMKKAIFFPSVVQEYAFESPNEHFVNGLTESGVYQVIKLIYLKFQKLS
jgi:hypothetical protein